MNEHESFRLWTDNFEAPIFYYLRDAKNRPVVTVCLIRERKDDAPDAFYRGVAVCSLKDQPNKKIGRAIAYERACQATCCGSDLSHIVTSTCRRREARMVLSPILLRNVTELQRVFYLGFPKSNGPMFVSSLHGFERKLMNCYE